MSDIIDEGFYENTSKPLLKIIGRKKFVFISLIITLILRSALAILQYVQFGYYESFFAGDFSVIGSSEILAKYITILALLYLIAVIVNIVSVCTWVYRANQNIHLAELGNIKYSSGWAVGWFFIPFANLVKPASVMGEILNSTNKLSGKTESPNLHSQGLPTPVVVWWAFYVISYFIANLSTNLFNGNDLEFNNYGLISGMVFTALVFSIISAIFLIKLINGISKTQENARLQEIF